MRQIVTLSLVFSAFAALAQNTQTIGNTVVEIDTVASGLDIPWEIQVDSSQQYLWVTERVGRVRRIDLGTGENVVVLDYTDSVEAYGEAGMLGMALHPEFESHRWVYITYCYGPRDANDYFFERVSRFHYNGTNLVNEEILLDSIGAYGNHNGSRLLFLQDGTLLMSTGDHNVPASAQDSASLNGKFLRLNADGSIPSDNPDPQSYVYTSGHRNPQGVLQLSSGKIISSEHGPDSDDEINIIEAGNNYGWPLIYGFCDEPFEDDPCATLLYTEPRYHWTPTIAPNDLVYYDNTAFPEWNTRLLMTSLKDETLYAIQMEFTGDNEIGDNVADVDTYFSQQFGRLRDIAVDSLKRIYLATNSGDAGTQAIIRLTPPNMLSVSEHSLSATTVFPNPATKEFAVSGEFENLVILDNSGRIISEIEGPGTKLTWIDVAHLRAGSYIVRVKTMGGDYESLILQKI